ncbi:MAG: hypothetical protein U0263_17325 [Polyangiaceae bacterium]
MKTLRVLPAFGFGLLFACAPAPKPIATAPAFEPAQQSKCRVKKSSDRPLVIEWPSADRAALESTAKHGLVVVRYSGCEMEVLPRCQLGGSYRYTPTTKKLEKVSIRDADELYAQVPVGAAKLEAKLEKAGELNVAMHVVGRFDAVEPEKPKLEGACEGATHVVTAMTSGAFEFFAGAEAEAGGGASVLGAGAGAKASTRNELLSKDGDPAACASSADAVAPPQGCGAILRLEVSELGSLATLSKSVPLAAGESSGGGGLGQALPAGATLIRSGPGVVKLHIESPDPNVELQGLGAQRLDRVAGGYVGQGASTLLCRAPCDTFIDARLGQPLQITGADIPSSSGFQVYDREGDVTAKVRPGSSSKLTWSAITGTTGFLAVITGGSLLLTGVLINSSDTSTSGDGLVKWGGITLGAGAVLTTTGILLYNSGTTDVTLEGGNGGRK